MIKFPLRDLRAECGETTEMYRPRSGRLYFGLLKHVGSVADSLELGTGVVEGNVSRFQPGAELGEGRLPLDFSEPPHLEVMLESVIEFAKSHSDFKHFCFLRLGFPWYISSCLLVSSLASLWRWDTPVMMTEMHSILCDS